MGGRDRSGSNSAVLTLVLTSMLTMVLIIAAGSVETGADTVMTVILTISFMQIISQFYGNVVKLIRNKTASPVRSV